MNPFGPKSSVRMIDAAGVAACLIVTAAVFALGVQPMIRREADLRQMRTRVAAEQARADELSRSLADVRRQVTAIERAVHNNPLRLHPRDHLNARLSLITSAAAEYGIEIDRLEPGRPTARAHFVTVPIRVGGRGGYVELTRFLHQLHRSAPDTAVASIDLRGQPGIPTPGAAAATFSLELIWHAAPDNGPRDAQGGKP